MLKKGVICLLTQVVEIRKYSILVFYICSLQPQKTKVSCMFDLKNIATEKVKDAGILAKKIAKQSQKLTTLLEVENPAPTADIVKVAKKINKRAKGLNTLLESNNVVDNTNVVESLGTQKVKQYPDDTERQAIDTFCGNLLTNIEEDFFNVNESDVYNERPIQYRWYIAIEGVAGFEIASDGIVIPYSFLESNAYTSFEIPTFDIAKAKLSLILKAELTFEVDSDTFFGDGILHFSMDTTIAQGDGIDDLLEEMNKLSERDFARHLDGDSFPLLVGALDNKEARNIIRK
jgi:hypothetical protein